MASLPRRNRNDGKIPGTAPSRFTPEVQENLLNTLRQGWSLSKAAQICNLRRKTIYDWMEQHPEFGEAVSEARLEGNETVEDEAFRRAVEGIEKPVYYRGDVVGSITEYSDSLLSQQLEARLPDKYRRNLKIEGGAGSGNVTNILIVANSTDSLEASRTYKALIQSNGSKE